KLALRHILESSDEERTTPALCHDAGHAPQVLHNASRSNNSESKVDIRARHAACDYTLKRRQVPGVDRVPNQRYRDFCCGIELEDAERLLGPVVLVRQQIRDEAACLAETLGFGKTQVGLLDLLLRPFSIVNIGYRYVPADDLARFVF